MSQSLDLRKPIDPAWLERRRSVGDSTWAGELAAQDSPRLASLVLQFETPVRWSLSADPGYPRAGHPRSRWWLTLAGELSVTCERCLQPMAVAVSARRGFEFVETAEQADQETEAWLDSTEPDPEMAEIDILSLEDGISLLDLVEDEALLSMPQTPKHASCEPPAETGFGEEPETTQPFAGLRDLLKGKPPRSK